MQKLLAQIMKFGVVGVIATVIDFGIMNLLHYGLGLNILIANTSGFIVSLIFNYVASMKYVFAHKEGMSRRRAFALGALSGVVEPVFGLLTVLAVGSVQALMPWLLSFAAGAMLYVVVEELIPEANLSQGGHTGTLGVMTGFLMMMILDVALG